MACLSRRPFSSLLRSGFQLRGDATAAVCCSSLYSNPVFTRIPILMNKQSLLWDGIGVLSGIKTFHSRAGNSILWRNSPLCTSQVSFPSARCFSHGSGDTSPPLDRNFLAQLWISDMKKLKAMEKRYRNHRNYSEDTQSSALKQPPVSQSMSGLLKPTTSDEVKIATLLARSNLLITRDIEWGNLVLGFEQENRYSVVDVCYPQALLRTRRPFVASITDALGNELFRVRFVDRSGGSQAQYMLRLMERYTCVALKALQNSNPMLRCSFSAHSRVCYWCRKLVWSTDGGIYGEEFMIYTWVKDADGEVLAQIDRDWRGFGFEIFTDAGQYVIRFGKSDAASKSGPATMVEELEVKRPLTLSERAVALALAISLDNDYFSRHGGWGIPFMAVGE
ncbi:unnamed protein product [Arabis nemorensis]|uniref:Phospholipid scramblase n=1 Tax=Arabis nemorensis TaxID=586526 RepID=A0A565B8H7_9BRAS|nr:unnamed protein product [Arabis nemorensis]